MQRDIRDDFDDLMKEAEIIGKKCEFIRYVEERIAFSVMDKEQYPCSGHECYDRGNFHVGCENCSCYNK